MRGVQEVLGLIFVTVFAGVAADVIRVNRFSALWRFGRRNGAGFRE
jgi:hypothetical protein